MTDYERQRYLRAAGIKETQQHTPKPVITPKPTTVNVGSSGTAQKGLAVGSTVNTGGGTYKIVAPGTAGASYNPASGYYSVKVSSPTPTRTTNTVTAPTVQSTGRELVSSTPTTLSGSTDGSAPIQLQGITWKPEQPPIGQTGAITGSDYYAKMLAEQQAAIQARIDNAVQANNAYIPQIDQRSDQALRNAYIAREQSRLNAPQALSAMGIGGGAAESSLLGIQTGYENTRNVVEDERMRALEGLRQNEAQIRATGDSTLADAASQYYNNLARAAQQAEQNAINQANWEAEFALQERKYSDAAAQQAWQNAYDERLFQMQNQPTNTTYRNNVSNAQTANVDAGKVAPVSSGNYNTVWSNVQRALGVSNMGSQRAFDAAINYIQNSLKSGTITENEAQQMINRLNL